MDHFSFSQLVQYEQCPYSYYLVRIANVPQKENAFAQAGSLMHSLLYRWAAGKLPPEKLPEVWENEFEDVVTEAFPAYMPRYRDIYKRKCGRYLTRFIGFPEYEIIGAEKQFSCDLEGNRFVGIIDLILRDKETGQYMILDHKSSSISTLRKSQNKMYRQLLLYSKYLFDTQNAFPSHLRFNLFKEGITNTKPFRQEEYEEAVRWADKLIHEIGDRDIFDWLEARPDPFYCTELCGSREHCSCAKKIKTERRIDNERSVAVRTA